ncbi:free fatty acid receptor 2-like [Bufo bufo]|uniref:free fatty acid receptor 2-like n=1 Tax=Bufo bufo TaxID=8384 RepID=UPI001ABE47E5|nr:free fatty acid receptor 2-like [Bufo bufo]
MYLDTLSLVIYVMTLFLGLPSNLLVFYIFFKKARTRLTPNLIYMINLCVSDLLFIMLLPVKITETFFRSWTLPEILCPLFNFIHFSTIYASVFFLTAVSVGRYLSVAFPIKYKIYKKPKYSLLICLCLWTLVIAHISFVFVVETSQNGYLETFLSLTDDNMRVCYENFTDTQLAMIAPARLEFAIVLFFLPLTITIFCYASCIQILRKCCMHVKHKKRATRVAVTTLTVFIICFAPYNISHVVGFIEQKSVSWRKVALLLSTCNAFLDPLIFYFLSTSVDQGFYQAWKSLQQKYSISKRKFSSVFMKEHPDQSKARTIKTISATTV